MILAGSSPREFLSGGELSPVTVSGGPERIGGAVGSGIPDGTPEPISRQENNGFHGVASVDFRIHLDNGAEMKIWGFIGFGTSMVVGVMLRFLFGNDMALCNSGIGEFAQAISDHAKNQCQMVNALGNLGAFLALVGIVGLIVQLAITHRRNSSTPYPGGYPRI